jgi:transcriptional regulator with XRE-family HTH domain
VGFLPPPTQNQPEHFGEKLQALRGLRRMKQKEVAFLLGISQKSYSRLELKEKPPNALLLEKIIEIFDNNYVPAINLNRRENETSENSSDNYKALTTNILKDLNTEVESLLRKNIKVGKLNALISIEISIEKIDNP